MIRSFDFPNFGTGPSEQITVPQRQGGNFSRAPSRPFSSHRNSSNQAHSSKVCDICKKAKYVERFSNEYLCESCIQKQVRVTSGNRLVQFSSGVANIPDNARFRHQRIPYEIKRPEPYTERNKFGWNMQPGTLMSQVVTVGRFMGLDTSQIFDHPSQQQRLSGYAQLDYTRFPLDTTTMLITQFNTAREEISQTLDSLHRQIQLIERHCCNESREINYMFGGCVEMVERRQMELLDRIEKHKCHTCSHVQEKVDSVQECLLQIMKVSDSISEALMLNVPLEIKDKIDRATRDLQHIRMRMKNMPPIQEVPDISFVPLDPLVHNLLSTLGGLVVSNNFDVVSNNYSFQLPSLENAIGRPIYGLSTPVCVLHPTPPTLVMGKTSLCRPWGVCCDREGNIIVADRSNHRIITYNFDGTVKSVFGVNGEEPGQFNRPAGLTIDTQDRLIVVDKDNHRVQIFTLGGVFILLFGRQGSGNGDFNYPWDVAVNSKGTMVVTDSRNRRIQFFDPQGSFLGSIGATSEPMYRHFDTPRGVCFAPNGDIIITDFNLHKVIVLDKSLTHCRYIGSEGKELHQLKRPQGVICDDRGNIIVADSRNYRIQVFHQNGDLLNSFGKKGTEVNKFDRPIDVALTPEGRIIVVEFENDRVQVF